MDVLDVNGNAKVNEGFSDWSTRRSTRPFVKILQNVVLQGKKLGKAVYVFSVDSNTGKVAHCNFIPGTTRARGIDARVWAAKVAEVLGGKVLLLLFLATSSGSYFCGLQAGGKEDSSQGVGVNVDKLEDALTVAREYLSGQI